MKASAVGRQLFLSSGEHVRPMAPRRVTIAKEVRDGKFGRGYLVKIEPDFRPVTLNKRQVTDHVVLVPRHGDDLASSERWPICVHINLLYHPDTLDKSTLDEEQRYHWMWGELYATEEFALASLTAVYGESWRDKKPL